VHTEYFVVDGCAKRKAVDGIVKSLPELDAEAAFTLVEETVDAVDRWRR
jgi:hypothetical protein